MIALMADTPVQTGRPGPAEAAVNALMRRLSWDHNMHYHRTVLRRLPDRVGRALDVGCGKGAFARVLARRADHVDAVDVSPEIVDVARSLNTGADTVRFLVGDVRDADLELGSYDAITSLAVIHHMPFAPALDRLRDLLAPGGVLVVLGCYTEESRSDVAVSRAASFANIGMGLAHRAARTANRRSAEGVQAPIAAAPMTLSEIRAQSQDHLPGATVRRHLFWRYSLVYRRPGSTRTGR